MNAFTTKQQRLIDEAIETHLNSLMAEDQEVYNPLYEEIQEILWREEE
jgi:hypothetical protein